MAHGDKKFIVTYDGRLKRSRHRTRVDYYSDINTHFEPPLPQYAYQFSGQFHHINEKEIKNTCIDCYTNAKREIALHNEWVDQLARAYEIYVSEHGSQPQQFEVLRNDTQLYKTYTENPDLKKRYWSFDAYIRQHVYTFRDYCNDTDISIYSPLKNWISLCKIQSA
jgi:hypothetical protein